MRARMALKLTNTKCEIREVRLNNKPKQMIDKSPKGTVPVLVLQKKVIDESNDIIEWALSSNNIFDGNIDHDQINLTNNLIFIVVIVFIAGIAAALFPAIKASQISVANQLSRNI